MSKSQTMMKLAAIAALLALGACSSGVKLDDTAKNGTGAADGTGADARTVTPVDVAQALTDLVLARLAAASPASAEARRAG